MANHIPIINDYPTPSAEAVAAYERLMTKIARMMILTDDHRLAPIISTLFHATNIVGRYCGPPECDGQDCDCDPDAIYTEAALARTCSKMCYAVSDALYQGFPMTPELAAEWALPQSMPPNAAAAVEYFTNEQPYYNEDGSLGDSPLLTEYFAPAMTAPDPRFRLMLKLHLQATQLLRVTLAEGPGGEEWVTTLVGMAHTLGALTALCAQAAPAGEDGPREYSSTFLQG